MGMFTLSMLVTYLPMEVLPLLYPGELKLDASVRCQLGNLSLLNKNATEYRTSVSITRFIPRCRGI
jgi:hypothetical protein